MGHSSFSSAIRVIASSHRALSIDINFIHQFIGALLVAARVIYLRICIYFVRAGLPLDRRRWNLIENKRAR